MPTSPGSASTSSDATAAIVSFREAAKQQLKKMTAHGVDEAVASERLLDELVLHGTRSGGGAASSTSTPPPRELSDVIALTGYSRAQASKTLLLKEEIGLLRRQGHGTATLVEMLQKRLRFAPHTRGDENGAAQPCTQPHKKPKLKAGTPHEQQDDIAWPPLPPPPEGLRDSSGGLRDESSGDALVAPLPARRTKRAPDAAGSSPPKRLKPAALSTSCPSSQL